MTHPLTAESITNTQIKALRDEAQLHGNHARASLCRVAMREGGGSAPATLKRHGLVKRGGGWWRNFSGGSELMGHSAAEAARQLCAEIINTASARSNRGA